MIVSSVLPDDEGQIFRGQDVAKACADPGGAFGHEKGGHCVLDHVFLKKEAKQEFHGEMKFPRPNAITVS